MKLVFALVLAVGVSFIVACLLLIAGVLTIVQVIWCFIHNNEKGP